MIVTIIQPLFIPWMGYFGLMDMVDKFVIYDDVQFTHRSWQHRNRIKTPDGVKWLTIPIQHTTRKHINNVLIDNSKKWQDNLVKTIYHMYHKAPYYKDYEYLISWLKMYHTKLFSYTSSLLYCLCGALNIRPVIVHSSNIAAEGKKTERLINILKKINADEYIACPAAKDYLKKFMFRKAGIKLKWLDYQHPKYPQLYDGFQSHMSVLDLIFNVGPDALDYIKKGEKFEE
jgi:hypothetical protein